MKRTEDIILIAGPTASGKTSVAIEIARANGAVIFNADSMQVYKELQIVSARPSEAEEAQAQHFLFGHVSGNQTYSVAHWLRDVAPMFSKFRDQGRQIIFVGGTGLYFNALLDGLSPMPEINPDIREKWRSMDQASSSDLHRMLDPVAAEALRPSDRQRILRALEVFESTGRSIFDWQAEKGEPLIGSHLTVAKLLQMPPRVDIHDRINRRFDLMIEQGALDEVRALLELGYPESVPVMKAIGVPQLASHLRGEFSLDEAIERAKAATRQYAKRQSTWFNNSFDENWINLSG